MNQIDLKRYLVIKENRTDRKRFDSETLLQVVLFAFMEHGYVSVREIEKLCKTYIRFMWLLQEMKAPSFMTIDNFMKNCLVDSMDEILSDINAYIFRKEKSRFRAYLHRRNKDNRQCKQIQLGMEEEQY